LQDDTVAKPARKRDVRLQPNALLGEAWQNGEQSRNDRISPICRDDKSRLDFFVASTDVPAALVVPRNCRSCDSFAHDRAEFTRSVQQQLIEQAAFYGDLSALALRQFDLNGPAADRDELDDLQRPVRQFADPLRDAEASQNRPARRVQTIAAYFFARESFALDHDHAQSRGGAKRGTARAARTAADNCDVGGHDAHAVFAWVVST
jgi:hypothetical protein